MITRSKTVYGCVCVCWPRLYNYLVPPKCSALSGWQIAQITMVIRPDIAVDCPPCRVWGCVKATCSPLSDCPREAKKKLFFWWRRDSWDVRESCLFVQSWMWGLLFGRRVMKARLPKLRRIRHWSGGGVAGHAEAQALVVHGRGRNDLGRAHLLHLLDGLLLLALVHKGGRLVVLPWHLWTSSRAATSRQTVSRSHNCIQVSGALALGCPGEFAQHPALLAGTKKSCFQTLPSIRVGLGLYNTV